MEEEKKDIQTQILELMKKHPDIYTETKQTEDAERRARNFARKIIIEVFPEDKEWVKELSPAFYDCILLYAGWTKETRKNGKITFRLSEKRIVGAFILFRQRIGYIFNHLDDIMDGKITEKDYEESSQIDVYDFLLNYPADGRDSISVRYFILAILDRLNVMEGFQPETASYGDILIRYLTSWHDTDTFMDAVEEYGKDNPYIQRIVNEALYPSGKTLLYLMVMEQYNSMSASRAETVADNNFPFNTQEIEITESEAETPISEYSAPSHVAEDFEEISFFEVLNLPDCATEKKKKQKSRDKQNERKQEDPALLKNHIAKVRSKYMMSQTKLSASLPLIPVGKKDQPILAVKENNKTGRKKAIIYTSLEAIKNDKNISVDLSRLTRFDMEVSNAVTSLILDGNHAMTPAMIFRKLTGQRADGHVTARQEKEVEESMERLRSIKAFVNHAEQLKAYGKNIDALIIDDYLIVCEKQLSIINGAITEAYVFPFDSNGNIKVPIICRYALFYGQMPGIPYEVLNVPVSNTIFNIELKGYLLHRLWGIRSKSIESKMLMSTIFKDMNVDTAHREQKNRVRKTVLTILDSWVKTGYIGAYTTEKDSRGSVVAINISISKNSGIMKTAEDATAIEGE